MFNNNSEEFHVNSTRLDPERLGRDPFTRQGLYQVVLFGVEIIIIIVCLGNDSACVGKGCEPQVLLAIWDSSASLQTTIPAAKLWPTPRAGQPGLVLWWGHCASSCLGQETFAGAGSQLTGATTEPCVYLHFVEKKKSMDFRISWISRIPAISGAVPSPRLSWW